MTAYGVEMILARNLVSAIELAAFLVDPEGVVVYFNDSAGQLIGRRFEEVGELEPLRAQRRSQVRPARERSPPRALPPRPAAR